MTIAQPAPTVIIHRPPPRRIAVTTPHINYELAAAWRVTRREIDVLKGIARGRSNGEIGRELFLSEETVKSHVRRLFARLSAEDRPHAVQRAWELGILRARRAR